MTILQVTVAATILVSILLYQTLTAQNVLSLLLYLCDLLPPPDLVPDTPSKDLRLSYDFIVVGAGSAGAVVASRLSEESSWNVLLLEAGGDENYLSEMPISMTGILLTRMNWNYHSEPQKGACLGFNEGRCLWHRGRGLGGTSSINFMVYTKGDAEDYDAWEREGNIGWGWKDVSPHFSNFEKNRQFFKTKLSKVFLDAVKEKGYSRANSGNLSGFSRLYFSMRENSRLSSSKAYLRPIRHRPNLHVVKHAHVTKILVDNSTNTAHGVEYYRENHHWRATANREVILSAGALNTPQLLLLSGIGPRQELEQLGISVIHDLQGVGKNLQDHPLFPFLSFSFNASESLPSLIFQAPISSIRSYINGNGPLTSPGGLEVIGYVRTTEAMSPAPNVEFLFASTSLAADRGYLSARCSNIPDNEFSEVFSNQMHVDTWTLIPILLESKSVGWIRLKDNNPLTPPLLHFNYLSDREDLKTFLSAIKEGIIISKTRAFQQYDSTLLTPQHPDCMSRHAQHTDEFWECVLRYYVTTGNHQCCTAKMGSSSDPSAVVDPQLRVYGVKKLRVIDASIIPKIPKAHLNAVCMMIGEKGAELIKLFHKANTTK